MLPVSRALQGLDTVIPRLILTIASVGFALFGLHDRDRLVAIFDGGTIGRTRMQLAMLELVYHFVVRHHQPPWSTNTSPQDLQRTTSDVSRATVSNSRLNPNTWAIQ
jgi:hypothetical protein